MNITENVPLAPHTTFKIGGPARFFCVVTDEAELAEAVAFAQREKRRIMVLGGGSNILIADAGFSGVVIKMEVKGIEVVSEDARSVALSVGAGEDWDTFVDYAVSRGLYGVENLSAIPGTVGAAPVQNIGAYGTDISSTVTKVRAFDSESMSYVELSNVECVFGYRDSLFKREKGRYAITRVFFKLEKNGKVNIEYKDLKEYFEKKGALKGIADRVQGTVNANSNAEGDSTVPYALNLKPSSAPSLLAVRNAVIDIRWKKLPDWKLWGTAGSFFKNPVIAAARYELLKEKYPDAPGYPEPDGRVKVPAGWLLDKVCNAKGVMAGNVGTYENQALVVVAKPGATAEEVMLFTKKLMDIVEEETTIKLEGEVEWVN